MNLDPILLTTKLKGCTWGLLNTRGVFFRALNPFLFPLYTHETFVLMLAGTILSFLQARIILAFVPFAILSLDYSKMNKWVWWGCVLWAVLMVVYQIYSIVSLQANMEGPMWAHVIGIAPPQNISC